MLIWELIKESIRSITANKLRALLTMLGIIIGVASVISMISIGEGAKKSITDRIRGLGTNLLIVRAGFHRPGSAHVDRNESLDMEAYEFLRERTEGMSKIAVEASNGSLVKYYNKNVTTNITGTTTDYLAIRGYELSYGDFIDQKDISLFNKVCILGSTVNEGLFGAGYAVGEKIKIKGVTFTVIGVLKEKGQSGFNNMDDCIIVPISTFQKKLYGTKEIRAIYVEAESEQVMDKVSKSITKLLRNMHRLRDDQDDDFTIRNQSEMLQTMEDTTKTFTFLLAGVAAVSLLVGGIGIMNIMLVSITERMKEIGIRKAIGATRADILYQFLIESVILSVSGGALGILLGFLISKVIPNLGGFSTVIKPYSIILAVVFSITVGIFFGLYPANKASKMDPVEALRYE